MKDAAAEIFLAMLSLALFSSGQIVAGGSVYLYLFLLAGTCAGAILVIAGGKNYAIFDTGANGVLAKFISHLAVVVGLGLITMDWALKAMPDRPPEAVATATGFMLALFGTTALLKAAPLVSLAFNLIRWKIQPSNPPPTQTQTADSATTTTQAPLLPQLQNGQTLQPNPSSDRAALLVQYPPRP